ncbi:MAG: hypothetical protein ABR582_00750 [Gemmatimonadaceae bacterium]
MNSRPAVLFLAVLGIVGVTACRAEKPHVNPDSSSVVNGRQTVTGLTPATGWDSVAGSFMVIRGTDSIVAAVVLPGLTDSLLNSTKHFELGALANATLDLFNLQGFVGSSTLRIASQPAEAAGCLAWPEGQIASAVPAQWTIGLEAGRVKGIKVVPIDATKGKDSTTLIADVLSVVSQLPLGGDAAFKGIPFSVRNAYRLATPETLAIVAEVVRKINEEANPREEHVLIIAERRSTIVPYQLAFHMISAGAEESLQTTDLLAAIKVVKTGRLAFVVSLDYEDGGKLGLLEKVSDSNWQLIWKSAYTGC